MKKQHSPLLIVLLCVFISYSQDTLQTVKVTSNSKGLYKSIKLTANTTLITSKELLKAACCNLAESFETNPSIDVNYSDALTGAKQIKMLGLTSPYLMITEENIPSVRGASQAYGMSFTPGTWVESIQITKGAGSVVNGYESFSGQINTELIQPINNIPFFLNAYSSSDSRFELNTHFNAKISDNWSSALLVHGNARRVKNDMNQDGFLDNPIAKQINVLNRYQYYNADKGWVSFINFRYMNDKKQTGEIDFDPSRDKGNKNLWGSEINTERLDVSTKVGYVFKDMPFQSLGFQNAFDNHNQESYFGLNVYNIKQSSYYSNLIFNSIINNTMNKFAAGLNVTYDKYQELVNVKEYYRIDNSVGAFFEYTYDNTTNFSFIAGGRIDNHNRLGLFFTPRLHLRYTPWSKGVLKASIGRAKRSANIFAENQSLFASSRSFDILNTEGEIYGLNPEIAWNYGLSFLQRFNLLNKKADIGFDLYQTNFQKQVVVDLYTTPAVSVTNQVLFYDLDGKSFASSLQIDFNIELVKHLDIRTAYKYYDIQTTYITGKNERPFQAKNRFFGNISYETEVGNKGQQWKFDLTYNWIGQQKLPETAMNPVQDRLPEFSPSYSLTNTQITRVFSPTFEVYVGGENIGNYKQKRPILGSSNPFGPNFDASIVYAPIFGQMYYAGLRFKIINKQ